MSGGGVDHWHRALAAIGAVPDMFSWEDGREFARPRFLYCEWRDGGTVIRVRSTDHHGPMGSPSNMNAYVTSDRVAQHPTAQWVADKYGKHMAVIQFPGAGTWGLSYAYATATFTLVPSELRVVQRRARQVVAGEGRAPKVLQLSKVNMLAAQLGITLDTRPHQPPYGHYVTWPSLMPALGSKGGRFP